MRINASFYSAAYGFPAPETQLLMGLGIRKLTDSVMLLCELNGWSVWINLCFVVMEIKDLIILCALVGGGGTPSPSCAHYPLRMP